MAEPKVYWVINEESHARYHARDGFELGRRLVSGACDFVSRKQAVLWITASCLRVEAHGSNPTCIKVSGEDNWVILRVGESMEISSGTVIVLDKRHRPGNSFLVLDHAGFLLKLSQAFVVQLPTLLPARGAPPEAPDYAVELNSEFATFVTEDIGPPPIGTHGAQVAKACLDYLAHCIARPGVVHGLERCCHELLGYLIPTESMEQEAMSALSGAEQDEQRPSAAQPSVPSAPPPLLDTPQLPQEQPPSAQPSMPLPPPPPVLHAVPPPPPPLPPPVAAPVTPQLPPPPPETPQLQLPPPPVTPPTIPNGTVPGMSRFDEWLAEEQCDQGVTLDVDQRWIVELACVHHKNIFYTGPGGVGKSLVTKFIIAFLKVEYQVDSTAPDAREQPKFEEVVAVVASTGIAATHIGGGRHPTWDVQ